uniref:NADPH oxidase 4 n=1 Tax=Pavo cristatus TaxID=9049 RepID=A0A8C9F578_PAVCR
MAVSWRSWLANEGSKHLFLFFWLSLNAWFFWKTFLLYCRGLQYYYLHQMLGLGLCVSRASASVLNLNCCLVLLPMCRILLAFLRGSQKVASRNTRRLIDKSKTFHVTCGVTICIFSGEILLSIEPWFILFRVSNYDIFWYTHNLFFVFYILLMLHVSGGVLKYQTNLEEHPPGCFNPNKTLLGNMTVPRSFEELLPDYTTEPFPEDLTFPEPLVQSNFMRICSKEPKFQSHFPETWFWISGPLCLYCVERLYRYIRSNKPVTITSVISHPSNVLEVRMIKDDFQARPGQYVILHCPRVSGLESHPFTLTMCPTDTKATFGVHLKVVGDWTERFRDLLLLHSNQDAEILPIFQQRRYPNDGWKCYKLRRLYFIWVCRDVESFRWFADLLCMLHNKLWQENRPDYINIQLYLSQTDGIQVRGQKLFVNQTRLWGSRQCKLSVICKREKTIGVFCCGPSKMSKILHKLSNSSNPYGTRFEYNKESFS